MLLVGPPGTGKTLLARAVAGEAGVPFYSISGSDFVEVYVGVGASRVRDLFDKAKKTAPSIIFIDEIDAVGRQRGAGLGGGHDEREQTLNQLLVEMDGFEANSGVIVMAATNRADILDGALTRSGRFDRQIYVNVPDVKGREEILKVHSRNKPLAPDVDLRIIAKSTPGFTGADLENILNEAALAAAKQKRKAITMKDINDATTKVMMGPEKRSRVMTEKDRRLTAYHETGHAIAVFYAAPENEVHEVSIIPRGSAGGYTMPLPKEDLTYTTKSEMLNDICVSLAGVWPSSSRWATFRPALRATCRRSPRRPARWSPSTASPRGSDWWFTAAAMTRYSSAATLPRTAAILKNTPTSSTRRSRPSLTSSTAAARRSCASMTISWSLSPIRFLSMIASTARPSRS